MEWLMSLPWNRLHVFANHLVASGFPIAHVGGDDEDVTGKTEREQRLVHGWLTADSCF
jgi:hypothetical protein